MKKKVVLIAHHFDMSMRTSLHNQDNAPEIILLSIAVFILNGRYRRLTLFAVLVLAVLTIHGPENRGKPQIAREKIQF